MLIAVAAVTPLALPHRGFRPVKRCHAVMLAAGAANVRSLQGLL